ncbi:MAG: hypothetical protein WC732_08720 [Candidatus Omnitrophota bacterium]
MSSDEETDSVHEDEEEEEEEEDDEPAGAVESPVRRKTDEIIAAARAAITPSRKARRVSMGPDELAIALADLSIDGDDDKAVDLEAINVPVLMRDAEGGSSKLFRIPVPVQFDDEPERYMMKIDRELEVTREILACERDRRKISSFAVTTEFNVAVRALVADGLQPEVKPTITEEIERAARTCAHMAMKRAFGDAASVWKIIEYDQNHDLRESAGAAAPPATPERRRVRFAEPDTLVQLAMRTSSRLFSPAHSRAVAAKKKEHFKLNYARDPLAYTVTRLEELTAITFNHSKFARERWAAAVAFSGIAAGFEKTAAGLRGTDREPEVIVQWFSALWWTHRTASAAIAARGSTNAAMHELQLLVPFAQQLVKSRRSSFGVSADPETGAPPADW